MAMKINYEGNKLTVSDVSIELFKKIVEIIEDYEGAKKREEKSEEWRSLAKDGEKTRLEKVT
jgi:hypothetical protein